MRRNALSMMAVWCLFATACATTYGGGGGSDPVADLRSAVRDTNTSGYIAATTNDGKQATASLTNPGVRERISIPAYDGTVPVRFTRITDTTTGNAKTYRTALVRKGDVVSLQVMNLATNQLVFNKDLPRLPGRGAQTFDSLLACIDDFNCKHKGELQCEANRTCEPQFAALTCCLTNGECFSVHIVVPPTSPRCQLRDVFVDFESLTLSQ